MLNSRVFIFVREMLSKVIMPMNSKSEKIVVTLLLWEFSIIIWLLLVSKVQLILNVVISLIQQIKHEYLRSRAYICLSLSSSSSSPSSPVVIQIWPLSRYSCFHLGSLHPRNFILLWLIRNSISWKMQYYFLLFY